MSTFNKNVSVKTYNNYKIEKPFVFWWSNYSYQTIENVIHFWPNDWEYLKLTKNLLLTQINPKKEYEWKWIYMQRAI